VVCEVPETLWDPRFRHYEHKGTDRMHVDEHVLAAYMAGELSNSDRAIVTEKLVYDQSLRNWLHMATMALSAARGEREEGPYMKLLSMRKPLHLGIYNADRPANPVSRNSRHAI